MRNATCAASKTSKVPTQDALLFISYSMALLLCMQITGDLTDEYLIMSMISRYAQLYAISIDYSAV